MKTFKCYTCKQIKELQTTGGTGYGYDRARHKICYACCAIRDEKDMLKTGRAVLYLTTEPDIYANGQYGTATVTNWPGSLKFTGRFKRGEHNIARYRFDAWFKDKAGKEWHGVQYGQMSQIIHCKRIGG